MDSVSYDECLYKLRNLVENAFLLLKGRRGSTIGFINVSVKLPVSLQK